MTKDEAAVLKGLIEALDGGSRGFAREAERLELAGLYEVAEPMRTLSGQRARFARELRELAQSLGAKIGEPHDEQAVSVPGDTNEDRAVVLYWRAIEGGRLGREATALVGRQAFALKRAHDEMRSWQRRPAA